jgi:choline dehydrogenase-like flavoprotein
MLIDIDQLRDGETLDTGVCIIGAGAAGITLALELDAAGVDVCLLEAGGIVDEIASSARYRGALSANLNVTPDYLTASRLRYFGGSTNHWAGWCRPLDEIDFEVREWIPFSGWPFSRSDLAPWYRRAAEILEVEPFAELESRDADPDGRFPGPRGSFRPVIFHMSPPVRFAPAHAEALVASQRVRMLLGANVTELRSDPDGARVRAATLRLRGDRTVALRAARFILASGGIENARLLLVSRDASPAGLGNQHDRVGRFFMDHPHRTTGTVAATTPEDWRKPFGFHRPPGFGCEAIRVLKLDEAVQRAARLPNMDLLFRDPRATRQPALASAAEGFAQLDAWDGDEVEAPWLTALRLRSEPIPDPESRVTLSDERDDLGMQRVRLDWRLSRRGADAIEAVSEIFAAELGAAGRGRVKITRRGDDPMFGIGWGSHHIGTTRMHDDPKQGVVDGNGRVHGVANLFVAGSSVFPTAGVSNPTLTLVALSLRLAERVARGMPG